LSASQIYSSPYKSNLKPPSGSLAKGLLIFVIASFQSIEVRSGYMGAGRVSQEEGAFGKRRDGGRE